MKDLEPLELIPRYPGGQRDFRWADMVRIGLWGIKLSGVDLTAGRCRGDSV